MLRKLLGTNVISKKGNIMQPLKMFVKPFNNMGTCLYDPVKNASQNFHTLGSQVKTYSKRFKI